jgi:hypothetical protein
MPNDMSGEFSHFSLKSEVRDFCSGRATQFSLTPRSASSSQLAGDHRDGVVDLVGAAVAVILREALERVQRPAAVRGGDRALMWWRGAAALGVEFVGAVAHHLPDPA